jgi:hypothetical protein
MIKARRGLAAGLGLWPRGYKRLTVMRQLMKRRIQLTLVLVAAALMAACTSPWAHSAADKAQQAGYSTLVLEQKHLGAYFPVGAVGLSTEVAELTRGRLTASHYRLVRLMRLLGPSTLRIGGGTEASSWWTSSGEPAPAWARYVVTPADLSIVHQLLLATGWHALLDVDFGHFEPERAADEVRYAQEILGPTLLGIEIGNEPDHYNRVSTQLRPASYDVNQYLAEATAYRNAIMAVDPGVAIYGPDLSEPSWLSQLGSTAGMFTVITQHYYPIHMATGCSDAAPSGPQPTATELLSPSVINQENSLLETLAAVRAATGRATQIDETNSVDCEPSVFASPGFAGSLWALDWVLRAISSGVSAIDFHGGLFPCVVYPESPICTPGNGRAARAGEVAARPVYYGLLAARQLEGGRFIPTHLASAPQSADLSTWATESAGGTVRIAIDNLATSGGPVRITVPAGGFAVTEESLTGYQIEEESGITLGGAAVTGSAQWLPRVARSRRIRRSQLTVTLQPASAMIITLVPAQS